MYLFTYDSSTETWTQQAKLVGSGATVDQEFGSSIALSGDRALIGVPEDDGGGYASGSAYVFDMNDLSGVSSEEAPGSVERTRLLHVAPSPVMRTARVLYTLARGSEVRLTLFDALGRRVAVLASGMQAAGPHEARFDASGLPSGVYVLRLEGAGSVDTQPIVVAR